MMLVLLFVMLLSGASALPTLLTVDANATASYLSTPSPFLVRPLPLPYPPLDRFHLHQPPPAEEEEEVAPSGKTRQGGSGELSAAAERRLGAFFKLAHSRILTDGRATDIRALAAGLFPVYLQLCAVLGGGDADEAVNCDAAVGELFRARYNELQIEVDRMDRLHFVLVRLMRAHARWIGGGGKRKARISGGGGAAASGAWRRAQKEGGSDHGKEGLRSVLPSA